MSLSLLTFFFNLNSNSVYENTHDPSGGGSPTPPHYAHPAHTHSPQPASPSRHALDAKKVHFSLTGTQRQEDRVCEARNEEVGRAGRCKTDLMFSFTSACVRRAATTTTTTSATPTTTTSHLPLPSPPNHEARSLYSTLQPPIISILHSSTHLFLSFNLLCSSAILCLHFFIHKLPQVVYIFQSVFRASTLYIFFFHILVVFLYISSLISTFVHYIFPHSLLVCIRYI